MGIKEKITDMIKLIFGYGIMITLFAGGLTFFGYLIALIIGGEKAEAICGFIYKNVNPVLVVISTCMILLGLLKMYICKETAFTAGTGKRDKKEEQ